MGKKLSTIEFVKKAIDIYNNKYDYSKVIYGKADIKVEIICFKHGSFWKSPHKHLSKQGCPKCSRVSKHTTKSFIEKALEVHKNKYDYSKVKYKNAHSKIEIHCIKCNKFFWQTPGSHLFGQGCPYCARTAKSNTKEFTAKSIKIHGDKYDYSKVLYINDSTKVEIVCMKHGSFYQKPNDHLMNHGCGKCSRNQILTTEEFVEMALKVHNNLYDYSKVNYIRSSFKIEITCKFHGSFWQLPSSHLQGQQCPKCFHYISEPEIKWLNENNVLEEYRQYKIKINNKRGYKVDGYDPKTNTIYEFLGDYWHGNPERFNENDINERSKKTFGELYQETVNRIELFKTHGYNVKYMWESDFKKRL